MLVCWHLEFQYSFQWRGNKNKPTSLTQPRSLNILLLSCFHLLTTQHLGPKCNQRHWWLIWTFFLNYTTCVRIIVCHHNCEKIFGKWSQVIRIISGRRAVLSLLNSGLVTQKIVLMCQHSANHEYYIPLAYQLISFNPDLHKKRLSEESEKEETRPCA